VRKEIQEEGCHKSRPLLPRFGFSSALALPRSAPAQSLPGILNSFFLLFTKSSFLSHTQTRLPLCWGVLAVSNCWNAGFRNTFEGALKGFLHCTGTFKFRALAARHHGSCCA
jgi:hypothetical protein